MQKGRCSCNCTPKFGMMLNVNNPVGFISGYFPSYVSKFSENMWTDGTNVYVSEGAEHFKLNSSNIWERKSWSYSEGILGKYIWKSHTYIYFSNGSIHKVYYTDEDRWADASWPNLPEFSGIDVWSDGSDIYHSKDGITHKLGEDGWQSYSFSLPSAINGSFSGANIWTDGINIFHSNGDTYRLSGESWVKVEEFGLDSIQACHIWTDGVNIYYSNGPEQYRLEDGVWREYLWKGFTNFFGNGIYMKGKNIYYVATGSKYVLLTESAMMSRRSWSKWSTPWNMLGGKS